MWSGPRSPRRRTSLSGCCAAVTLIAATLLAACRPADGNRNDTILLSAASDLAAALPALSQAFEAETGVTLDVTVGASGMLAQQILNGAPVDVFASADDSWVSRIVAAGRALPDTRATYARGTLAILLGPDMPPREVTIADLADSAFTRIAIANPDIAPYGRAARNALQNGGVWDVVQPRIIIGENVRQALGYVISGNVDAAIIARALVPHGLRFTIVPPELYGPLDQDVIVIRGSAHEAEARRFVEFLSGTTGRAILRSHNFTVPERTP